MNKCYSALKDKKISVTFGKTTRKNKNLNFLKIERSCKFFYKITGSMATVFVNFKFTAKLLKNAHSIKKKYSSKREKNQGF